MPTQNTIHEGERLRRILRDKNILQAAFAEMAGFSYQNAHKYFRKDFISRPKLISFCEILDISLDKFYRWGMQEDAMNSLSEKDIHHGDRLEALIEIRGWNKTWLAKKMGMSRKGFYKLTETALFNPKQMERVCNVFKISTAQFVSDNSTDIYVWKEKYYSLLEDFNKVLMENTSLKDQLIALQSPSKNS